MPLELFTQAVSLHQQGKLDDAGRLYQKMLERKQSGDSEVVYLLAFLRYQQGRTGEALQAVEAALARDPTVAKALHLHWDPAASHGPICGSIGPVHRRHRARSFQRRKLDGRGVVLAAFLCYEEAVNVF